MFPWGNIGPNNPYGSISNTPNSPNTLNTPNAQPNPTPTSSPDVIDRAWNKYGVTARRSFELLLPIPTKYPKITKCHTRISTQHSATNARGSIKRKTKTKALKEGEQCPAR
ncbi:hypothetical protein HanIR_Chr04g0152261 [Helianthus annuus]|nr:hypothetical protein HanIR_Chr04g0152261 [Helianthus annuus]